MSNLSPAEWTAYSAYSKLYQACVDAGLSHDEAVVPARRAYDISLAEAQTCSCAAEMLGNNWHTPGCTLAPVEHAI